jgi:uncharacterized membrane protein YbhN (UPF0104 family)
MADKILDLFQQSTIMQGLITLIVVGVYAYMVCAGRPVPSEFLGLVTLVIGFFFGAKLQNAINGVKRSP